MTSKLKRVRGRKALALGVLATGLLAGSLGLTTENVASDTLRIQTLSGNDDVTVAPEVSGLLIPVVDLGAGE